MERATLPTATEIENIRKGDKQLIDRYYMANYKLIVTVCKSYFYPLPDRKLYEDATNECYLYFSKFNFDTARALVRSIKDVCVYVRFGTEREFHAYRQGNTEVLTILDAPAIREHRHGGAVETVGETLESDFDILEVVEPKPSYTDDVYNAVLKLLTPRQREAFAYFYYTDMTAREVGKEMGLTLNGAQSLKTAYIRRLRKQSNKLLQRLQPYLPPHRRRQMRCNTMKGVQAF